MARSHGGGVLFRLQGSHEGSATLTLLDVRGRAVWNGAFDKGLLAWDGTTLGGARAVTGVYFVRVELRDMSGGLVRVLDRKVPFTR